MAQRNLNADINVGFENAASRQLPVSGESLPTVIGKVSRYCADLNPVAFSGSYADLTGVPAPLTFDTTPTSGSANPVTSGGIYTALQNVSPTITIDSTPTSGSANAVSSGGVYTALAAKQNIFGTIRYSASHSFTTGEWSYNVQQQLYRITMQLSISRSSSDLVWFLPAVDSVSQCYSCQLGLYSTSSSGGKLTVTFCTKSAPASIITLRIIVFGSAVNYPAASKSGTNETNGYETDEMPEDIEKTEEDTEYEKIIRKEDA